MVFRELLTNRKVLLADGAWGTELAKCGLGAGVLPEALNLNQPDAVRAIAAAYIGVGATIIETNTFGGNRFKLERAGLGERLSEVNRAGVGLSQEAAGGKALVLASIGPTGELLEPYGTTSADDIRRAFGEQVKVLAEAGADGISIETMTDLAEAKAALKAVRDECDLPAVVSMTFDKGPRGYATMMGVRPEEAAHELTAAGADVVGSNCGLGIKDLVRIAGIMRSACTLPLWMKPNAGLPRLVDGRTVFPDTPQAMAAHVRALVDAGASVVGGCCGTTPEYIRLFATELEKLG